MVLQVNERLGWICIIGAASRGVRILFVELAMGDTIQRRFFGRHDLHLSAIVSFHKRIRVERMRAISNTPSRYYVFAAGFPRADYVKCCEVQKVNLFIIRKRMSLRAQHPVPAEFQLTSCPACYDACHLVA